MKTVLSLIATLFWLPMAQAEQSYTSPVTRVHMLEVFSTQSCSSCPPAQNWVNGLKKSKNVWKTFIPVVFHVDYWDYLGWKDPYSSPQYTRRQRDYVTEWFKSPAYTPMIVLDGEVSRIQYAKSPIQNPGPEVGVLSVDKLKKTGQYKVRFHPKNSYSKPLMVYYSVLGSGISTEVKAGENDGKTLKHDFLSLKMDKKTMTKVGKTYQTMIRTDFSDLKSAPEKHIVFWVSEDISKKPIQIVGGPL